ncbi:uncharacterized protein [Nicotiana sylvestris]|uniref:uncharacterized protein n=1 Tax=Nicotiana sylvestris TaxID=4096 RepID=UPI00388CCB95
MVNHGDRIAALEQTVDGLLPIMDTVPELRTSLGQRLDDLDRRVLQAEVDIENISRDSEGDRQTAATEAAEIFGKFEGLQQERAEDLAYRAQEADRVTAMQQTIDDLTDKLNVVNATLQGLLRGGGNQIGGAANPTSATQKLKIPEPKPYSGARNAKEVENFIFDVEQYFDAVGGLEEAKKVATAAMYLQGDAKLWWRVQYEAIKAGEDALETWAELKATIRLQFFPENVEYNSRRKLRELRQTKSVRDYVREFSALMLSIRDMGDKDKLFTFLEGLKPYARMELQRQRVDTLPKAIQAAECLGDYQMEARKDRPQPPTRGFKGGQSSNGGPSRRCRHCGGPHWNNECPHAQMNAHQTFDDGTDDDSDDADQTEPVGAFNAIVGSISEALAETSAGICGENGEREDGDIDDLDQTYEDFWIIAEILDVLRIFYTNA